MPELPEVELARRILSGALEGARVTGVRVADARVVEGGVGELDAIVGARAVRVERRGKRLRVAFAPPRGGAPLFLFSHLGMSGKWAAIDLGDEPRAHERVRIDVSRARQGGALSYVDPRRFGRLVVAGEDIAAWRALGPDPLADGIDPRALYEALHARRRTVKEALLDQKILAGVGNIHAVEGLWRAKLDPRARTDALTLSEVRALAKGVGASLAFGLAWHESENAGVYVEDAGAPNPFRVYGRKGPCPRCGAILTKIVMGGRGTTFCPVCQRASR